MPPEVLEFASLLGFLDLQTHTINRMTPQNYIWFTYCRNQEGIHSVSGLPYSLMDLLSSVHMPGNDSMLLSWQIPDGAPAQQCLWKATRFAAILRTYQVQYAEQIIMFDPLVWNPTLSLEVLVDNIFVLVQQCLAFVPSEAASFKQTLIFPLVMAASQRAILTAPSREFICQTIEQLASERHFFLYQGILRIIRDFWDSEDATFEDSARRLDIELCLL